MTGRISVALFVAAFWLLNPHSVQAQPTSANCTPVKTAHLVNTSWRYTEAPSPSGFETLPGTKVNFTTGPNKSCVVVHFIGHFRSDSASPTSAYAHPLLDGTIEPTAGGPDATATGAGSTGVPLIATFVFTNVPKGAHTIKFEFCCHNGTAKQKAELTSVAIGYSP